MEHNVRTAIQESGSKAAVEKIQDIDRFIHYGIARIPALVIDEKVYAQGKVLSVNDVKNIIEQKVEFIK